MILRDIEKERGIKKKSHILISIISIFLLLAFLTTSYAQSAYYIVSGDSMYPTYKDGDIVKVSKQDEYQNGDVVVADVGGKNVIKRINGDVLEGDNKTNTAKYNLKDTFIIGIAEHSIDELTEEQKSDFEKVFAEEEAYEILLKKNFGGTETDKYTSVASTSDGGYIAVGWAVPINNDLQGLNKGGIDAIIVKYNSDGTISWKKTFGGTKNDYYNSVAQTSDGGYIAVGVSNSTDGDLPGNKGNDDAIIVKYNSAGTVSWKKNFGGGDYESYASVVQSSDGGYVAVGYASSNDGDLSGLGRGSNDAIIVKYNSAGTASWKRIFGSTGSEAYRSVAKTSDGGYIAVGVSNSTDGDLSGLNKGGYDAIIVKYDSTGSTVNWKKNFGGTGNEEYTSVVQTSDGGYILVGYAYSIDGDLSGLSKGSQDAIIVKYNSAGTASWKRTFGGTSLDTYNSVVQTGDDGYVAVGYTLSDNGDLLGINKGGQDAIIVKYDSTGTASWKRTFGGTNSDQYEAVASTSDGRYIAVGHSLSADNDLLELNYGGYDGIIVKYRIDPIPPNAPTINITSPAGFTGNTNQDVTFTITDNGDNEGGSGVDKNQYSYDNANWTDYSAPVTLNTEGSRTIYARTLDVAGNISENTTQAVNIDRTGPAAPTIDIVAGTYNIAQNVTVTAAGDAASTHYTLDGTDPDNTDSTVASGGKITVDGNNAQTITLKLVSYDAAGNKSNILTTQYTFDKTTATITVNFLERIASTDNITATITVDNAESWGYKWTNSKIKPTNGWTTVEPVTQTGNGVWYLHIQAFTSDEQETYVVKGPFIKGNIPVAEGYEIGTAPTDRKNFKYYIGKDKNGITKAMLVSITTKDKNFDRDDILDEQNKYRDGIYYIDRDGKIKQYSAN